MAFDIFDDVAFYFVSTSLMASIILPPTFYMLFSWLWYSVLKKGASVDPSKCICDDCVDKEKMLESRKTLWTKYGKKRYALFALGWIIFLALLSQLDQFDTKEMVTFDPFKILEVEEGADDKVIKKAYRRQSLRWHPDKNADNLAAAEKQFLLISKAYQVLTDEVAKENFAKYGNADGYQGAASISIALPSFLTMKKNELPILLIYLLLFVVAPPVGLFFWWQRNSDVHDSGLKLQTIQIYYTRGPNRDTNFPFLIEMACMAVEFIPLMKTAGQTYEPLRKLFAVVEARMAKEKNWLTKDKKEDRYFIHEANVLLHAYMRRERVPIELEGDMFFVLEQMPKLLNFMLLEITSKRRREPPSQTYPEGRVTPAMLAPSTACVQLMQCLSQQMWVNDSHLLQLPYVDNKELNNALRLNVATVQDLKNASLETVKKIFGERPTADLKKIGTAANRIPTEMTLQAHAEVDGEPAIHEGDLCTISITLERRKPYTRFLEELETGAQAPTARSVDIVAGKKPCGLPHCAQEGTKLCSRCKVVRYCCADHQKEDWKEHKKDCVEQSAATESSSSSSSSPSTPSSPPSLARAASDDNKDGENGRPGLSLSSSPAPASSSSSYLSSPSSSSSSSSVAAADGEFDIEKAEEKMFAKNRQKEDMRANKGYLGTDAHCPLFPHEKKEVWYVSLCALEKREVSQLLGLQKVPFFKDRMTVTFSMPAPEAAGIYNLEVFAKCDSYVGVDMSMKVNLYVHRRPTEEELVRDKKDEKKRRAKGLPTLKEMFIAVDALKAATITLSDLFVYAREHPLAFRGLPNVPETGFVDMDATVMKALVAKWFDLNDYAANRAFTINWTLFKTHLSVKTAVPSKIPQQKNKNAKSPGLLKKRVFDSSGMDSLQANVEGNGAAEDEEWDPEDEYDASGDDGEGTAGVDGTVRDATVDEDDEECKQNDTNKKRRTKKAMEGAAAIPDEKEDDDDDSDDEDEEQMTFLQSLMVEGEAKWYYLGADNFFEGVIYALILGFGASYLHAFLVSRGWWGAYFQPPIDRVWEVSAPVREFSEPLVLPIAALAANLMDRLLGRGDYAIPEDILREKSRRRKRGGMRPWE